MNNDLKLLDCTLRDGGYVNEWKWGFHNARAIIRFLTKAEIDFVEVGFLRDVTHYDEDKVVCNTIEELNLLLPEDEHRTIYSAMAMRSNYDISKLTPYSGKGIELIRITAHEYDLEEGMDFARKVKEKGYKLSINPINIMGYSDEKILKMIEKVNIIQPYQFSVVDTFGSMKRRDLDRIISLVDNNLDRSVRLALHLHENMSLSCCLAQNFIDKHLNRPVSIDGSLMGMGRIPGNLPIELIADYCNDYVDKNYDIDYLMDAIQDHIAPIKGESNWGYTPAYFLSAKFNLHRNYAEHYLKKGDLNNRDINHILASFEKDKSVLFDDEYADKKYFEYKNNKIDDIPIIEMLKKELRERPILILAPGASINDKMDKIKKYIKQNNPIVVAINFIPEKYNIDYVFFSNARRFAQSVEPKCKLIITSNIESNIDSYKLDYNSLSSGFEQGYNSFIMLLKLMQRLDIGSVAAAGVDGYTEGGKNYYKSSLKNISNYSATYNTAVHKAIQRIGVDVLYITHSAYQ